MSAIISKHNFVDISSNLELAFFFNVFTVSKRFTGYVRVRNIFLVMSSLIYFQMFHSVLVFCLSCFFPEGNEMFIE